MDLEQISFYQRELELLTDVDFYTRLGIEINSNYDDVKRAYRVKALKYHPDLVQDPSIKQIFEELIKLFNEAYYVLRDPKRKSLYDLGKWNLENMENSEIEFTDLEVDLITLFSNKLSGGDLESESTIFGICADIQEDIEQQIMITRASKEDMERLLRFYDKFLDSIEGSFSGKHSKHNLFKMALMENKEKAKVEIENYEKEIIHAKSLLTLLEDYLNPKSNLKSNIRHRLKIKVPFGYLDDENF